MNKKILIQIIVAIALVAIAIGVGAYFASQGTAPSIIDSQICQNVGQVCGGVGREVCCGDLECQLSSSRPNAIGKCIKTEVVDIPDTPDIPNKTCVEQKGDICSSSETCPSSLLNASDSTKCCSSSCKTADSEDQRYSFFTVHIEAVNTVGSKFEDSFNKLKSFIDLSESYGVRLTLLFSPQWAELIIQDTAKLNTVKQWVNYGHEIGAHHHGPESKRWDGYTHYSVINSELVALRNSFGATASEEYIGNMSDFIGTLNTFASKLGTTIKTFEGSFEDGELPQGILYVTTPNTTQGNVTPEHDALLVPYQQTISGHTFYRLSEGQLGFGFSSARFISIYNSSKEGVLGAGNHDTDYSLSCSGSRASCVYTEWFEFLKSVDPNMKYIKTVSEIMEMYK